MLRTVITVGILAAIHLLTAGCASTLDQQRRMADLAEAALASCKRDHSTCRAAKLCSSRAAEASKVLQDARRATAEGRGDVGMDLDATLLVSGAEALCERAGVTSRGAIVVPDMAIGDMPRSDMAPQPPRRDLSTVSPDLSTPPSAADLAPTIR